MDDQYNYSDDLYEGLGDIYVYAIISQGVLICVLRLTYQKKRLIISRITHAVSEQFVQTHLSPTFEKPLNYKSLIPQVSVASVLNQQLHIKYQPFYLLQNRPSKPVILNQRRRLNVVLSKTNKYAVRHKLTF